MTPGQQPLRHVVCSDCRIRFGVDETELRFMEQTEITLWCPRGHQLKVTAVR